MKTSQILILAAGAGFAWYLYDQEQKKKAEKPPELPELPDDPVKPKLKLSAKVGKFVPSGLDELQDSELQDPSAPSSPVPSKPPWWDKAVAEFFPHLGKDVAKMPEPREFTAKEYVNVLSDAPLVEEAPLVEATMPPDFGYLGF